MRKALKQHRRLPLLATVVLVALIMVTGCAPAPTEPEVTQGPQDMQAPDQVASPVPGPVECEADHVVTIREIGANVYVVPCELKEVLYGDCVQFKNRTEKEAAVTDTQSLFAQDPGGIEGGDSVSLVVQMQVEADTTVSYKVDGAVCIDPAEATPRIIVRASPQ